MMKIEEKDKLARLYNQKVPDFLKNNLTLTPYNDTLGTANARHLLSRTLFGFKKDELSQFSSLTAQQALDILLADYPAASPPLNVDERDESVPIGTTWVNEPHDSKYNNYRANSVQSWWIGLMLHQDLSLREKMVIFWHNHIPVERPVVGRSGLLYKYVDCLRRNALGNFQTLIEEITVSPAMLRYLNGDDNKVGAPNENYARELFELFTIGKGPLIAEGNYTNYTEEDVVSAARSLTGWRVNQDNEAYFVSNRHDTGDKQFSEALQNQLISDGQEEEYKTLIQLIFDQQETSKYIIRKLYRWFVYYAIDEDIETTIIEPLATEFRNNNYELKPVLRMLLGSQHFLDANMHGSLIKNPLDMVIGSFKNVNFPDPGTENIVTRYSLWIMLHYQAGIQEMKPFYPPDVAGWPAYYLEPQFHQLWINSVTLPNKSGFTNYLCSKNGIKRNNEFLKVDFIALAESVSVPHDVNVLIPELAERFFPNPINDAKLAELKDVLIPGLPDFEWNVEWNKYKNNPNDTNQKEAVENKLRNLVRTMFRMAEYLLS